MSKKLSRAERKETRQTGPQVRQPGAAALARPQKPAAGAHDEGGSPAGSVPVEGAARASAAAPAVKRQEPVSKRTRPGLHHQQEEAPAASVRPASLRGRAMRKRRTNRALLIFLGLVALASVIMVASQSGKRRQDKDKEPVPVSSGTAAAAVTPAPAAPPVDTSPPTIVSARTPAAVAPAGAPAAAQEPAVTPAVAKAPATGVAPAVAPKPMGPATSPAGAKPEKPAATPAGAKPEKPGAAAADPYN